LSGGTGATYIALDQANSKIRIGAKTSLTDANTGVHLGSDGLALGASSVFKVTHEGVLTATSATLTGVVTANTGYIGGTSGWVIATGKITSTNIGLATATGDATYAVWAGNNTSSSAPFSVTHAGALKAISGAVGGFTLGATTLTAANLLLDAGNQEIKLGTGNDIISLDAADATYRLAIGHATYGSAPFRVTKAGALTATSATVTGTITATAGTIGGFTVNATDGLYAGTGATRVQMKAGAGIWAGATAIGDAPFSVTNAGLLTATNATISGSVQSGGSLTLFGNDSTPSKLVFAGSAYTTELYSNSSGIFYYNTYSDDTHYSQLFQYASSSISQMTFSIKSGSYTTGLDLIADSLANRVIRPTLDIGVKLGDSDHAWKNIYARVVTIVPQLLYQDGYGGVRTTTHKSGDIGESDAAFDNMYADDFNNVADIPFLDDRDDLAFIMEMEGSGIYDKNTGLEIINDDKLPDFVKAISKDGKKEILYDPDGKPYFSVKAMLGWHNGAIRQLYNKVLELESKLN